MMENEKADKIYEFIAPTMRAAMEKLLIVGDDASFMATICTMVVEYCEKTGTPLKNMSNDIHQALIHCEEDEQ